MKKSFYQFTYSELRDLCETEDLNGASASRLYNWHYKKNHREACVDRALPDRTKKYIEDYFSFNLPKIDLVKKSEDRTVKFLFQLHDGLKVETVLIPFQNKYTICLSSQVGCAMNCSFCFTGKQGFSRHLATEEIVGQLVEAKRWLSENRPDDDRLLNVVYMGQGEPLHNFDAVKKSAEIFLSQHGLSLAAHRITVSTAGYLPGLKRWQGEMPNVNIALSLHSPLSEKRNELIPINKKYPLDQVVELVNSIPKGEKRFVTYEYLLIKDFNDSAEDAHATGKLLKGKKAFINLIPVNSFPDSQYQKPSESKVLEFKLILEKYNLPTTLRTPKGDEVQAACGQLNTQ